MAVMVSLTIVWSLAGAQPVNRVSAQLEVLRRISREPRVAAMAIPGFRPIAREAIPPLLRIRPPISDAPGGAGPSDRPVYQVPSVPAGTYRLRPGYTSIWLVSMIGIGRDQFSLISNAFEGGTPAVLNFPVDVRAIVVRANYTARTGTPWLTIEPIAIVPPWQRLTVEYARHAVRYGTATVFFLDDRSFPEPAAFWVGGGRQSRFVLQPGEGAATMTLLARNAPVDNRVVLESGSWREEMQLGAGEQRRITVPIEPQRGAALLTVTTTAGFRPSAADPRSRDDRFLGVWIRVEDQNLTTPPK
jgi:hypothetical protein